MKARENWKKSVKMIKIFVACHKPAFVLKNELLYPIQVGAALSENRIEGMLTDDTGENISKKNLMYCELTAQYWVWKNVTADYVGFFHYRRYMSFERVFPINNDGTLSVGKNPTPYVEVDDIREDLSAYKLDEVWMKSVICRYSMFTILRERINTTVYRQYCQFHNQKALDCVIDILKKKYPEYKDAADEYLHSKEIYYMNMFIMKWELFAEYASWLFDILETYEKSEVYSEVAAVEKRLMGFLGERLFGIFYTFQRKKGVPCAELPYMMFYNTEIKHGSEGVNISHMRVFRLQPTKIEIKVDMRKLNKIFPAGSRRRMLLRSIFMR